LPPNCFFLVALFWEFEILSPTVELPSDYPRGRISTLVLFVGRCGRVRGCAVTAVCSRWQRRAAAAR
ncbi:unnamed protein product, partial [Musa acuminata subsp. burmannicoides]